MGVTVSRDGWDGEQGRDGDGAVDTHVYVGEASRASSGQTSSRKSAEGGRGSGEAEGHRGRQRKNIRTETTKCGYFVFYYST